MPESKQGRREILLTLASRLPEKVLQELLPGVDPRQVRDLLVSLAGETPVGKGPRQQTLLDTIPPSESIVSCLLYTDGASRGNPGQAGAGAVLLDQDGTEIGSLALYLGECTNNVAEYRALLAGLDLAAKSGCRRISVRLDSELVVRQLQGIYKVKNSGLQPLFEEVRKRLAGFEQWDVRHVRREENARADRLANQGIDEGKEKIGVGA
ncbi:MAG: hypothetical protein Kow0089_02870 [Desulfobulbaceae bacterium]